MKKMLGVGGLLVVVCVLTALLSEHFVTGYNIENLVRRSALFGIISIGAAFVIISGGIDLSIGSIICLVGCMTPWLLVEHGWPWYAVVPGVLILATSLGLVHGLLVTVGRVQPFIVTLCGLLVYRGVTRGLTSDQTVGFRGEFAGLRTLANGRIPLPFVEDFSLPAPFLILVAVTIGAVVLLNMTVYGRHLLALGRNEDAARYSGVATTKVKTLAYMTCGFLSGLGGLLFVLDVGSAQPVDFGNFYELYAIAAAVLGGCSLRGGEGAIVGVVLGTAVMQVLRNSITLVDWIPNNVEYAVIGAVILAGVLVDEQIRRVVAARILRARDAKT